MIRRSSLIALEIVLGLLAALLIGLGVAWWRLSQGPVDLSFMRDTVEAELSSARSGRPVTLDRVELSWSQAAGALELRAIGVAVRDASGLVLTRSQEARIELSALPLVIGRIKVERADFLGGDISITRKADGAVHLALGPPGAPADIVIPPPPINETLEQRVNRLLDGLEAAFKPIGPGGRLKSISIRGARLAIIDEAGGGRWRADAADLQLARERSALALVADALLEGAEGQAPANLRITTDTAFRTAVVEFGARDVRPRALLPPSMLGPFAALDAPMTATISVGLDREAGINRLDGEVSLGRGQADMPGGRFSLDGGRVRGRYELESDELIIDQLHLAGAETRVRGEVRVRNASSILRADPNQPAAFDVSLPALTLDVPGLFERPLNLTDVQVVGDISSANREITFRRLHARAGEATAELAGRLYWAPAGRQGALHAGVAMQGQVSGAIAPQTVMQMWPMTLTPGARSYLAGALQGGRVSNAQVRMDIRPADLAAGQLRNESLNIRFDFADAQFRFLQTMSPLTGGRGRGVLQGNRFDLILDQGQVNGLAVTQGRVEIPRLKPKGALMTVALRAEGAARQMVEVLLQRPLALGERLPVEPASVNGHAVASLSLQRPMLADVPFEDLRFNIDGRIDNFAGTMSTRRVALSQGSLRVQGDHRAIVLSGPVRAGTSNVDVRWTETLAGRGPSSAYQISGDFDAGDLVRLGYGVAAYAQGRVGVVLSGQGAGFDADHGEVELDLRNAAVESPWLFWTKRAGQPATVRFDIARGPDNSTRFNNLDARGGGLVAQGSVRVNRAGDILEADLSRLAVEGRSDARVTARRGADFGLDVAVRGALFDAAPFMDASDPQAAASAGGAAASAGGAAVSPAAARAEPPVRASVIVDRLKMRGGVTLSAANVAIDVRRGALIALTASGRSPGDRAFSLGLGPRPDDPQGGLRLRADDAGFAMRALTGGENIVGGRAEADGEWRGGPPSYARATLKMYDFQVVRLPAMTRLLSSAGSLTGLVETLNGDGIGFSTLEAPIVFRDDRLTITEARMSGPSLGLTASGTYNMKRDNLDIDGVVVPSYGLNSMLGAVPILGDLFVSRRGEGVFGMNYFVNGAAAEPRVAVNPLSAVTPGILRRLFDPFNARAQPPPPPDAAPAAAPASTAQSAPFAEGDAAQ